MNTEQLIAALQARSYDRVTSTLIVQQLTEEPGSGFAMMQQSLDGSGQVVVVRDEDVNLVKVSADLVASFVAAASVGAWAPAAIAALVVLLYRIRRKSFEVTALQGAILDTIRTGPPLTPAQIAINLGIDGVDESAVLQELTKLSKARSRDKHEIGLSINNTDGTWSAAGI